MKHATKIFFILLIVSVITFFVNLIITEKATDNLNERIKSFYKFQPADPARSLPHARKLCLHIGADRTTLTTEGKKVTVKVYFDSDVFIFEGSRSSVAYDICEAISEFEMPNLR